MLYAQQETAIAILNIPPSPFLNGMGAVGAALPSSDEFGFFHNPAQLAYHTRNTPLSAHFHPLDIEISSEAKPMLKGSAFNIGFNVGGRDRRIPINFSLGYMSMELDAGEAIYRDATGNELTRILSSEYYDAFALAMGIRYHVEFYAGINYKTVTSQPGYLVVAENQLFKMREQLGVVDYGFLMRIPIFRIPNRMSPVNEQIMAKYRPFLNASLGYAKSNIGDEVKYNDELPLQPLPRIAKLGYGLSFGFDLQIRRTFIRAVQIDWSVEANDLLVKGSGSNFDYQSVMGDINISRNIFRAQGDTKVQSRLGFSIDVAEFFRYSIGYFEGGGIDKRTTRGFGIRTKGIFKLFRKRYTQNWYSYIVNNLDIRYFYSTYYVNPDHKSSFHGISFQASAF
jgi:hypothetical protein